MGREAGCLGDEMSSIWIQREDFAERQCAKCLQKDDLTPLGNRDLCPKHFRETIADLDLKEQEKQENSGAWER